MMTIMFNLRANCVITQNMFILKLADTLVA